MSHLHKCILLVGRSGKTMSVVLLVDVIIFCGFGNKRSKGTFLEGGPLFTITTKIGFIKKKS